MFERATVCWIYPWEWYAAHFPVFRCLDGTVYCFDERGRLKKFEGEEGRWFWRTMLIAARGPSL